MLFFSDQPKIHNSIKNYMDVIGDECDCDLANRALMVSLLMFIVMNAQFIKSVLCDKSFTTGEKEVRDLGSGLKIGLS